MASKYLAVDAEILKYLAFESALSKIQSKKQSLLTSEERRAVVELVNCRPEHPDSFATSSLAERAKKTIENREQ